MLCISLKNCNPIINVVLFVYMYEPFCLFQLDTMSTLKDRLTDQEYQDWLKAGLVLKHLKEGLESFLDHESSQLQQRVINIVSSKLPQGVTLQQKNCRCTSNDAKNRNWTCPFYGLCSNLAKELVREHRLGKLMLDSTDVVAWTNHKESWEIAKCFMARGYRDKATAQETDCTGLMGLIANCQAISRKFQPQNTQQTNAFEEVIILLSMYLFMVDVKEHFHDCPMKYIQTNIPFSNKSQ